MQSKYFASQAPQSNAMAAYLLNDFYFFWTSDEDVDEPAKKSNN